MSTWTTQKVADLLNLNLSGPSVEITDITTDSRQVKLGSLFIAIKGDTHDGHAFLDLALKSGAAAVVSETAGSAQGKEFFQVPSTLDAIRTLAHAYRKQFNIPVIGVVGAVGKTTTKELFTSILTGKYTEVMKTIGSQNGFLGIPLTLLTLTENTQAAVVEIGIDDIGAMDQHMRLVEPTHLILTKIGPEHLHQLKSVEIAAQEELKAFDYALEKNLPMAINLSDEYVSAWFQKNRARMPESQYLTYSLEKPKCPEFGGHYDEEKSELTVQSETLNATFKLPLPGAHHAHNLLASIVLSQFFKLSVSEIRSGLSTFKTAFGRTEIYTLPDQIEVIGDYYNSNPTSLEAAITLLVSKKGKFAYHAVLGDMLELGTSEEQFHRDIAAILIEDQVSDVWLYGERMKWLKHELEQKKFKNVHHFSTHDALTKELKISLKPNSRILVKGSRGMKMEKVLMGIVPVNGARY
jgi:UDP-N-acetylmuramoyl-tripeptide--D-alanyl-D-alanine ligase